MAVGALLLAATVAAPRVDAFISASQRRSLRMCSRCGDLRVIPCSRMRRRRRRQRWRAALRPPISAESIGRTERHRGAAALPGVPIKGPYPMPSLLRQAPLIFFPLP
ncbi:unnamed protein product [Spirodela intermedia]|uniref:Uncharacterized protein n=1 Tax=Spirodela intermedia TaxID=51605 RepID=A0A7I8IHI9_SPIIN|nr:unnamed protein product [Spirodela intermedia]CAA6657341.1 unnamed protein product [Spirodela intermedia]